MSFAFAGGGIFKHKLKLLAEQYKSVQYFGSIEANKAAQLNADYQWALLPIEDGVTRYAFPSKSSSYAVSGALILAICGENTSVAHWIRSNRLGLVIKPNVKALVAAFKEIEFDELNIDEFDMSRTKLKQRLNFDTFISNIKKYII